LIRGEDAFGPSYRYRVSPRLLELKIVIEFPQKSL